jgi:HSP20 family protein
MIPSGVYTPFLNRKGESPMARWQPFDPVWSSLKQLEQEMGRLLGRWTDQPAYTGSYGGAGSYASPSSYAVPTFPALNLWEDGDNIFLSAELPGLSLEDLEIYVTGNTQLTIKGERRFTPPERAIRHRQERGFGKFTRVLTLPFAVNADNVEARLENGILNLKLAKHESAKPRKIPVRSE